MRVVPVILTLVAAAVAPPASALAQGEPAQPTASQPMRSPTSLQLPPASQTFLGGVPSGTATADTITITVIDAIRRALDHNLGVLTAQEQMGRAEGARWLALSALLPNVSGRLSETRQVINLAAFGFGGGTEGPFAGIPTIVGPFNVFDARIALQQSVFDLGAINGNRAENHNVSAAKLTEESVRNFVIHVAGVAYIQALANSARADAARAQQQTAQTLYNQAVDLKNNGLVAGIDVLRAQVQLNAQMQRVTASVNEFEKSKLALARIIGLPLGQKFAIDPNLPELPTADLTFEQTVERALQQRPDYQAAVERVHAAEAARQAIVGDALPSVRVNADYGAIGLTVGSAQATYTVTGALNVPIFNGGRTRGRLLQADADLRQRQSEAEDLKASIHYELQGAFLDLQATNEQLQVATRARDLAAQQLAQARDRFAAGVGSNIEVVQAQEAVAVAEEQFIDAKFGYELAKGSVIRGVGASQQILRQITGGTR
ncbi:MAG TPA: TolC family protein [Vicinamibacterales bacterium]|nr:TolC family protein [Vicinamibacterales bacterium]